jgi:Ca2+/H+ antiporter, TMEM165/GDT1 family
MNWGVFVSTFLAATIEVIEMVAIVVAVGVTRSWRASLLGAAGGLVVLVVIVGALGTALQDVSLKPIRLVVGALLLAFGSQWLRKGILSVSRDGWSAGIGEGEIDQDVPEGFDWTGWFLSFKGVSLEGLEVAVIVVAFGAAAGAIGSAVVGAAASLLLIGALGLVTYRLVARIPRRALQLFVGAMLVTFGTFWVGEGLSLHWPGEELALVWLGALYGAAALALVRAVSAWRRGGTAPPVEAERPYLAGANR